MSRLCGCSLLITDTTCSTTLIQSKCWPGHFFFNQVKNNLMTSATFGFCDKGFQIFGCMGGGGQYSDVSDTTRNQIFVFFVFYNCWKKKELKKTTRVHLCFSGWVYRVHNPKIWSLSTRDPSLLGIRVRAGPYLTRWPWIFRMGLLYTAPACAHTHNIPS